MRSWAISLQSGDDNECSYQGVGGREPCHGDQSPTGQSSVEVKFDQRRTSPCALLAAAPCSASIRWEEACACRCILSLTESTSRCMSANHAAQHGTLDQSFSGTPALK